MDGNEGGPDAVDATIARLYREGLSIPPGSFHEWALRQMLQIVPCDAALWGSGSAAHRRFHTTTSLGLPPEFPRLLEVTMSINPIVPHLLEKPDRPIDMEDVLGDEAFHASEVYRRVFGPNGIERILSTGTRDERSGLSSLVTLYRRDREAHFTSAKKARQQRLTFHLFNAASHNFFIHLLRDTDRSAGSAAAVIDAHGLFHQVQPRFYDLLDAFYPERDRGQQLPFDIPQPGETLKRGPLCISAQPLGELIRLLVWPAGPLDRLTAREREIVMAVSQGLSFKQAGRKMGVAPSTVANHLYRVYRKLGVGSRTELAAMVHPAA